MFDSQMFGMIMPLLSQFSTVTVHVLSAFPTALVATHRYTPSSRALAFDITNSTNPSSSSVGKMRRLGRRRMPFRYQLTPSTQRRTVLLLYLNNTQITHLYVFNQMLFAYQLLDMLQSGHIIEFPVQI